MMVDYCCGDNLNRVHLKVDNDDNLQFISHKSQVAGSGFG